ncbi:MAG TPA: PAS domain-containing protein [Alphaproteobacteria bacterium]|jgi:hypothetical protein|nr:PAS domain-containing protein [Alphaproteobacteria bacterium]
MEQSGNYRWEDLYGYWRGKHADGRAPARRDIDPPTEIPQAAASLMLIDIAPDGYQYRLVGSMIRERLGAELTGKAVGSSGQSQSIRDEWVRLLDLVSGDGRPRMLVAPSTAGAALSNLILVLPLIDDAGKVEQLLAGAFFNDQYFTPGAQYDRVTIREIGDGPA